MWLSICGAFLGLPLQCRLVIFVKFPLPPNPMDTTQASTDLSNAAFHLTVTTGAAVRVSLRDVAANTGLAEGAYIYRAARTVPEGALHVNGLQGARVSAAPERLLITGQLAGLDVAHEIYLPAGRPLLEERLSLTNHSASTIRLSEFAFGFRQPVTDIVGQLLPGRAADRLVAIPFRHRAIDPAEMDMDFGLADLLGRLGRAPRVFFDNYGTGYVPARVWASEGWAWTSAGRTLGVFKYNQAALEFSIVELEIEPGGVALRFGGAGQLESQPDSLAEIAPGQTVALGVTRLVSLADGHTAASYAFRDWLDENGCRFPARYNPPVHWNELYDNPEWSTGTPGRPPMARRTRPLTYTKALIFDEAAKAKAYGCQALYLDPGWDIEFGSLIWATEWLGDMQAFVAEVREKFGLSVSLHCPLAAWSSVEGSGTHLWPAEAARMTADGQVKPGALCLAASQYQAEAARRMLALCAGGARFLMFDGNAWAGECWNPAHGHAVPLTYAGHCQANMDLARRIHAEYPQVLIEMHDPIMAGMRMRYTPVYYGYDQPGSFDDNWGLELMWQPMEDILLGRARALYYYNLACNVPLYLHVDLRSDNAHSLVLWWYASTNRHLGIGGTHPDPAIAAGHQAAMRRYRELERFYKAGDFYGISEEFHIHALPDENAFVINLFNLSDQSRVISGTVSFDLLGLKRDLWYVTPYTHPEGFFDTGQGTMMLNRRLPAWGTEVVRVYGLGGRGE